MRVVQPVKLLHDRRRRLIVLAEVLGFAVGIVALLDEILPLLQFFQGSLHVPSY